VTAFERGVALQREGKLPGAIASYRQAIEFDPSIAGAWTNLAILLDEVGQHAEAVDAARMAVGLPATAEPARRAHAMHVLGHAQLGAGRRTEAIESLEQALAMDPAHEAAALALANAWLGEGKPDRAADALAAARAAGAEDAGIETFLAMVRWQQGRMDDAAAHAAAALRMDPANLEASVALAYAQLGLARWNEAAAGLESALKRRPSDANLHAALGYAYDRLGRRREAVDEFDRAIALEPAHPTAHAHRGASLEASGDVQAALEAFRKAEASAPVHSRSAVQTKLAVKSFQAGDMEQARALARRAIETDPTNAHARFVLGMAALRMGDRAEAEAQRQALEGKDPERAGELAKAIGEGAG
jgi:tetratricopeptide (TPR) repeat protein